MPLRTKYFKLESFLPGEPYYANSEYRRFTTIDTQISSILKNYSNGVISGFDTVKDSSNQLSIQVTDGLSIVPFFIFENQNDIQIVIEKNIAVRSYATTTINLDPLSFYLIYLVPLQSEESSVEVVVAADKNSFRNASPETSGGDAYLKYAVDLPSLDIVNDNVEIFINGNKYVGSFEIIGQYIIFPSRRLTTDTITVKTYPKDALIISEVETGESSILSINNSVKKIVTSDKQGQSIPEGLSNHNHKDDGGDLSLGKIQLTSKTRIISGTAVPPDDVNVNANSIYVFNKVTSNGINGLVDYLGDYKSYSGIMTSENVKFDEVVNLSQTSNIDYTKYYFNPDIEQNKVLNVIKSYNNGKNILLNQLVSSIIEGLNRDSDQYNFILYPYNIHVFINGESQFDGYKLIHDDNEFIRIKFDSPLTSDDVVLMQLEIIDELSQTENVLNQIDGLGEFSREDISIAFSASNIKSGYLNSENIARFSHIGRNKELLMPIPSDSDIDSQGNINLIYCESTDGINYNVGLKNIPPIKNTKHLSRINNNWYLITNNTVLKSNRRIFSNIDINKYYRNDSPIPIKTIPWIDGSGNTNALLLTEKCLFLDDSVSGWILQTTTSSYSPDINIYTRDKITRRLYNTDSLKNIEVDSNNYLYLSSLRPNSLISTDLFIYPHDNFNNEQNKWVKLYSSSYNEIKDFTIHDGYVYAIIRINGIDSILKTSSQFSNILSSNGRTIVLSSSEYNKYSVGDNIVICSEANTSSYKIKTITTSSSYTNITIDRTPNPPINISEDILIKHWKVDENSLQLDNYDLIKSINGKLYISSGDILLVDWVPLLNTNNVFSQIYDVNLFDDNIVISTDEGIFYLQEQYDYFEYGYGIGFGYGFDYFDVYHIIGTKYGYGPSSFETQFSGTYGIGYGFEETVLTNWVRIYNNTFDTSVNDFSKNVNYLFTDIYDEKYDSKNNLIYSQTEMYLCSDYGLLQIESLQSPYDLSIRNCFCVLSQPLDFTNNIFIEKSSEGKIINVNKNNKYITVISNLENSSIDDVVIFGNKSNNSNSEKYFRIIDIIEDDPINNIYRIRIDRFDGKYTKDQKINAGDTFRVYPKSDPLVFINNLPQSRNYSNYINEYSFDYQSQKITFTSALSFKDIVNAVSYIKNFYCLRGPWQSEGIEKIYINNKFVSKIEGTWSNIRSVEYFEGNSLVKEVIIDVNSNLFIGFNLKGLEIIANTSNPDNSYVINSNSYNSIKIRTENPDDLISEILTNSTTEDTETISNIDFLINIPIVLHDNVNLIPFGNIGFVSLPSSILTSSIIKITIPSTINNGSLSLKGSLTHKEIENAISEYESGLNYNFSSIRDSNFIQYLKQLNNIIDLFNISSINNVEVEDSSLENVIDEINSTIENSILYSQEEFGDFSRNIFNIISSDDLGGTYALTDKGVYFKENTNDSSQKWIKKNNIVKYFSVDGNPEIPTSFKGVYLGYNKNTDTWSLKWGETYILDILNNGLNNHYVNSIDIDPIDDNILYIATKHNGLYRKLSDNSWQTLYSPGSYDANNNLNKSLYEIIDVKIDPSKNYNIFILLKNHRNGGVLCSNDYGSNFNKPKMTSLLNKTQEYLSNYYSDVSSSNHDYQCIYIPHINSEGNLGLSPSIMWGSNGLYRKQYGYGIGFKYYQDDALYWRIDQFNDYDIDSNPRSSFIINDIYTDPNNVNHIYLATSNGLYRSYYDGNAINGRIRDFLFIGNLSSETRDTRTVFDNGEYIEKTKIWVTFDDGVPLEIFVINKYFILWGKPLKLTSYEYDDNYPNRIILYFDSFDRNTYVLYAGSGFSNTYEDNVVGFASWVKLGENVFKTNEVSKILIINNIIYAASKGSGIFISSNNGDDFYDFSDGFTELILDNNLFITGLDYDGSGNLYCSVKNYGGFGGGVFKLVNNSWERIGGKFTGDNSNFTIFDGLDNSNILCLKVSKKTLNKIYVGTNNGVYYTVDCNTWQKITLPTENINTLYVSSDNNTSFIGTKYNGLYRSTDKGSQWYQDYSYLEKDSPSIKTASKWRVWSINTDPDSGDIEKHISSNNYINKYKDGILNDVESINSSVLLTNNKTETKVITDVKSPKNNISDYSVDQLIKYYPGVLETLLYNSENQTYISSINADTNNFNRDCKISDTNNPPSIFKTKNSINDFRKTYALLLDHETVRYKKSNSRISTSLNRTGLFIENKNYNLKTNNLEYIYNTSSSISNLLDCNICDIIKHPTLNKYYIATENHGVFETDDKFIKIKPTYFYRGVSTGFIGSYVLTDSKVDFDPSISSSNYRITISNVLSLAETRNNMKIDNISNYYLCQVPITSVSTNDVSFTSSGLNLDKYAYNISDSFISSINYFSSTQTIDVFIKSPTKVGDVYYDEVENLNYSFVSEDIGKKIYIYNNAHFTFNKYFIIESISGKKFKTKRYAINFNNENRIKIINNSPEFNNEITTIAYESFHGCSSDYYLNWIGMCLQPDIDVDNFYLITNVRSSDNVFLIDIFDPNNEIVNLDNAEYSRIYYSIFSGIAYDSNYKIYNNVNDIFYNYFIISDYSNMSPINNGLSYYYSEYQDDNLNNEINLKFNKLYFANNTIYAATEKGIWKYVTTDVTPIWKEINNGIYNYSIKNIQGCGVDGEQWLFACSFGDGIYRSSDQGNHWYNISYSLNCKKVWDISINPNNNAHVIIGTKNQGVFKTTNATSGSVNWQSDNLYLNRNDIKNWSVKSNIITGNLFAYSYGGGVFKSINSGVTWEPFNINLTNLNILDLDVYKNSNHDIVIVSTDGGGLFISDDSNKWLKMNSINIPSYVMNSVCFSVSDKNIIYISTDRPSKSSFKHITNNRLDSLYPNSKTEVYKTVDLGKTWNRIFTSELMDNIAGKVSIDVDDDDSIYISDNVKIYKSTDYGQNFSQIINFDNIDWIPYLNKIKVNKSYNRNINMIYHKDNGYGILVSKDSGITYKNVYSNKLDNFFIKDIHSDAIDKLSITQTVNIQRYSFDPKATIGSIRNSNNYTIIKPVYSDGYEDAYEANFENANFLILNESNLFTIHDLKYNASKISDGETLVIEGTIKNKEGSRFTIKNLYYITITLDDNNYKVNYSMIGNYVKINNDLYKICQYLVSGSTATVVFVDPTDSLSLGSITNASVSIGAINEDEDDIENQIPIIYASMDGSLNYSLNFGDKWIKVNLNISSQEVLNQNGIQSIINSFSDIFKFILCKNDKIFALDSNNETTRYFNNISDILKDGLRKSFGNTEYLYITNKSSIYRSGSDLISTIELSLPSFTLIQIPLKVSFNDENMAFFIADDKIYITDNLESNNIIWLNYDIVINSQKIISRDINYIDFHPSNDNVLFLSIHTGNTEDINGIYFSNNRGGSWFRFNYSFYENESLQKNNNIILSQICSDNSSNIYFNLYNKDLNKNLILTNNNGVIGYNHSGMYHGNGFWIVSTSSGLTIYIKDINNTLGYKVYNMPLYYWLDNPTDMAYDSFNNRLLVSSLKGLDIYNLNIDSNNKLTLLNHKTIANGLLSSEISFIKIINKQDGSIQYALGSNIGLTLINSTTIDTISTYINFDISILAKRDKDNSVIDLTYDIFSNIIYFITSDSIYSINSFYEISYNNVINNKLNNLNLTSIAYKDSIKHDIDYLNKTISFNVENGNLLDFYNLLVVKYTNNNDIRNLSQKEYQNIIYGQIINVEIVNNNKVLTIDKTPFSNDVLNKSIIINPDNIDSQQNSIININQDSKLITVDTTLNVRTGDKYILCESISLDSGYVIYSGESNKFTDPYATLDSQITYVIYYQDQLLNNYKIDSVSINLDSSSLFSGIKSFDDSNIYIASSSGLFRMNIGNSDLSNTNLSSHVNKILIDNHNRIIVATQQGIYSSSNNISNDLTFISIHQNIDNQNVFNLFKSSFDDTIIISSIGYLTFVNNNLLFIYNFNKYYGQNNIDYTKDTFYYLKNIYSSNNNLKLFINNNNFYIYDGLSLLYYNDNSDITKYGLQIVGNSNNIIRNVYYNDDFNLSSISTDNDILISDNNYSFKSIDVSYSIEDTDINIINIYGDDSNLFLSTNNTKNKLLKINSKTPYYLSIQNTSVPVDTINNENGLYIQTINSIKFNNDGTAIWAAGLGSLYYKAVNASSWTEVYSSTITPSFNNIILKTSDFNSNVAYCICENLNGNLDNSSNLTEKHSFILRLEKTANFDIRIWSSGTSHEMDPGRYSLDRSFSNYPDSYYNSNDNSISLPNNSILSNTLKDINIKSIYEINEYRLILGANNNNIKILTYPFEYDKNNSICDASLKLGFRSIDGNNFELPSTFEKTKISTSYGILEKYRPIRCVDVFESNYDEDLLFSSIFNPAELSDTIKTEKKLPVSLNEKSLRYDFGYLLMSSDGGINWSRIGFEFPKESFVSDLVVDGLGNIYVSLFGSSTENSGVYMSTDNGKTFTNLTGNLPKYPAKSLIFINSFEDLPNLGGTLYVGLWGGGIYKLETFKYGYGFGYSLDSLYFKGYGYGYEIGGENFFDVFGYVFENDAVWSEIDYDIGFKNDKNLINTNVISISEFKNNYHVALWIATEKDGILYSDSQNINEVGKRWIQRNKGILTSSTPTYILNSKFNESEVWLGTDSGFYKLDTETDEWNNISSGILSTANITTIEHDIYFYNTFIPITWNNAPNSDGTLVIRSKTYISLDSPVDDIFYIKNQKIGTSEIIYVGNGDYSSTPYNDISNNLDIGQEYYYSFYGYVISGENITYTKFNDVLNAEIKEIDVDNPNLIKISTFRGTVVDSAYIDDNTLDEDYLRTMIIVKDYGNLLDLKSVLQSTPSLLIGYKIKYNVGMPSENTATIINSSFGAVFVSGDLTSVIENTECFIYPDIQDNQLIGYALNPHIYHNLSSEIPKLQNIFEVTSNTSDTITVRKNINGLNVTDIDGMIVKEYRFSDGTIWSGNITVEKNGLIYTSHNIFDLSKKRRVYPRYGSYISYSNIRVSNIMSISSDKKLKAQTITPIYVGTDNGIYRSLDNGLTFEFKGMLGYLIKDIIISTENLVDRNLQTADDAVLYVSTDSGLFKSLNGSDTWIQIDFFGNNNLSNLMIKKEKNKESIYVNYVGYGIYKSIDKGASWEEIQSDLSSLNINDIDYFENDNKIILSTIGDGIYTYQEPNNEKFNIIVKSDNLINNISNINTHLGDVVYNYRDRFIINSILRNSLFSNLKYLDFKTKHEESIEISAYKEGLLIDKENIYLGSDGSHPPSNPFKINKVSDDNYPSYIFCSIILSNGNIFVGTNRGGFLSKDGGNSWFKSGNYLTPNIIYSCGELSDDKFYIGTNNGLWVSEDYGVNFRKDQIPGSNVRAIWSYKQGTTTRFFIATDNLLRIITKGDNQVTIHTPETFSSDDGVVFSWSSFDEDGNHVPGGMPKTLLDYLNIQREYWIPSSDVNPLYSFGWSGTLVVRNEGEVSDFIPENDTEYGKKYRRFVEAPNYNVFWDSPPIRPFPDGLIIVDGIVNNSSMNALDPDLKVYSSKVLLGVNTFNSDVPFNDESSVTKDYDRNINNLWGAYPEPFGDLVSTTKQYLVGNGAELKPSTTYTYTFFSYFLRPIVVPYDLKAIGVYYRQYYQFTPEQYTYDIKIRNIPNSTQLLCGDSLSIDEWVLGTDDGAFYSNNGTGIKKSIGFSSGESVTALKIILTNSLEYVFGYGWGYGEGSSYFDVFDMSGLLQGYGVNNFESIYRGSYGYGWGSELRYMSKIFAATVNGIYVSYDRGISYTLIYSTENTDINKIYNFNIDSNNEISASTNLGILHKNNIYDTSWVLEPVVGSVDYLSNGRILGQAVDLNEI